MVNIDVSIVNVILPSLVKTFDTSISEISLITLAYLLSLTAFLLLSGKLSDMFGPEPLLTAGYGIFIIGSFFCGFSQSLYEIVLFRFIQGIGASMLFSTSAVIIIRYIPEDWRGRAYGINGLFAVIGFAIGSPIGGFIQETLGWSWIFFVNIPIGIIGILISRAILTKPYPRVQGASIDWVGVLLSIIMLSSLTYTLHMLSSPEDSRIFFISCLITIISPVLFLIRERQVKHPLLDFSVFRDRILNLALLAFFFYMIILAGTSFLFPFFFINIQGMSVSTAGLFLAIPPVVSICLVYVSGWLSDKTNPRVPCIIGMIFCFFASLSFLGFNASTTYIYIIGSFLLFGIGIALFVPASLAFIMNRAKIANAGTISAIKTLVSQIGGILGISIFALILSFGTSGQDMNDLTQISTFSANFNLAMTAVCICAILGLFTCIIAKEKQITTRS